MSDETKTPVSLAETISLVEDVPAQEAAAESIEPNKPKEADVAPRKNSTTTAETRTKAKSKVLDQLRKKVPAAEGVAIYRVLDGREKYIERYSAQDLERHGTIESFIEQYLVPKWGRGEYVVRILDDAGEPKGSSHIDFALPVEPPAPAAQPNPLESMSAAMEQLSRVDKAAREQARAEQDRYAQLQQQMFNMMQQQLQQKGEKGDSSPLMLMMMQQMMQAQSRPSAPQVDLAQELRKALTPVLAGMRGPSAPPPPPAPDPLEAMGKMMQGFAETMKGLMPDPSQGLTFEKLLALAPLVKDLLPKPDNELKRQVDELRAQQAEATRRELEELRRELRESSNKKTNLRDEMMQFRDVIVLARELGGGGGSANFTDFLTHFVDTLPQNSEAIGRLAYMLKSSNEGGLDGAPDVLDRPRPTRREQVPFPPGFADKVSDIEQATTDEGRIEACVMALQALWTSPAWQPRVTGMLQAALAGDTQRAYGFVHNFLGGIRDAGLLSAAAAEATSAAFQNNMDTVVEWLKEYVFTGTPEADDDSTEGDES